MVSAVVGTALFFFGLLNIAALTQEFPDFDIPLNILMMTGTPYAGGILGELWYYFLDRVTEN